MKRKRKTKRARQQDVTQEEREKFSAAYQTGKTMQEIANDHGRGVSVVCISLQTLGVKVRKRGKLTAADKEKIAELAGDPNQKRAEIARKYGISRQRVSQIAAAAGVPAAFRIPL